MYILQTHRGKNLGAMETNDPKDIFRAWEKLDPLSAGNALISAEGDRDQRAASARLRIRLSETEEDADYWAERLMEIEAEDVYARAVNLQIEVFEVPLLEP